MTLRITGAFLVCAMTLVAPGCTWVPLTERGQEVRVLGADATAQCRKLSTVHATTTDRVGIFARSSRKVREELESLARNEAAEAGGDAVVPIGTVVGGRQSFAVYRCEGG